MSTLDDLKEIEREDPVEIMRRIRKARAPESGKPDKLADYRDQRMNRPEGFGSIEPEIV